MPGTRTADLEEKRRQFDRAIALYESRPAYERFGLFIASANILLQAWLLARCLRLSIGPVRQLFALAAAYLIADFVNGLVHMYMDNNDSYRSVAGPLIANFHLHHKIPRYRDRPLPMVYFMESGSKVWLVPCLAALTILSYQPGVSAVMLCTLTYAGILSSVAEVSHYLAHNSLSPAAAALARAGLLLSKRRHGRHHLYDNVGYTFLNGITDPVVDLIARKVYVTGYKTGTDLHYASYACASRPG